MRFLRLFAAKSWPCGSPVVKWVVFCSVGRTGPSPAFAALPQFDGSPLTQFVERTLDADTRLFGDMRIDHCRCHVLVTQELLEGPDRIPVP